MSAERFDVLMRRFEELRGARHTTEWTWQQINDHELGRAREFTTFLETPGERRGMRIYDDTSKVAGGLLAGALHSLLSNPAARWFSLRFEDERINQIPEAQQWLYQAENAVFTALSRPKANFHAQLSEVWLDLVYFGTGALFIEDIPGEGVQFSARSPAELFLSEDAAGRIDVVIRRFRLSSRQAADLFGMSEIPEKQQKDIDQGKPEDKNEYLHFILPNKDEVPGMLGPRGMPWASVYLSVDSKEIVSEGGFQEMPMAAPRWQKETGEIYGRGPGWNALSDQMMLNEMKRVTLKAGQRAVDPPLLVDNEGVLGGGSGLHVDPGGVTIINAVMAQLNPPVQALDSGSNFNIGERLIADTRVQVQDAFHHQLIQMIRDPNMTATQVLELSSQMQRHLAPILGRMTTELLEPTIERTFAIEARSGRLPAAPQPLQGVPLKIEYVSPVARAQKSSDAQAVIQWLTVLSNLAQIDPGVMDIPDTDATARALADSFGVPPTLTRSPEQIEAMRQERAQQAEQNQQLQQLSVGARAIKDVSGAAQIAETAGEEVPANA
jgi:hypothetical protein